jgi:DNA-binding IclR family transcriptional regulator
VPRPALSASRSVDIINLLTQFPGRSFTLSEIARATAINVASCHAILKALNERGYLSKSNKGTYSLGAVLVAIGDAALKSQLLVARAQDAAQELFRDFGMPVLLSALLGDEIVAILALHDAQGRGPGIDVGERRPLLPPVGAPFIAWGSEAAIDAWLAKALPNQHKGHVAKWRAGLALIRQRGFQVTARSPEGSAVAAQIAQMASAQALSGFRDRMRDLVGSLGEHLAQLESIDPDETYDIQLIAAPIFNRDGECAFNLCLGGFPNKVSGALIQNYADRLVRACLQVMRADRAAQPQV